MPRILQHRKQKPKAQVIGSLYVVIFKEGKTYIACAPALDLVTQGTSVRDAEKNFDELVDIYLEETMSKGTLEQDLLRCGWRKHAGSIQPPRMSNFPSRGRFSGNIELKAIAVMPFSEKKVLCPA